MALCSPVTRLGRVLGLQPLRWLGVRSYGIYLWHFPIIALTTPADGHDPAPRAALQVAATIAVAALSWHFVEEPIRHGALGRWWSQLRGRTADRVAVPAAGTSTSGRSDTPLRCCSAAISASAAA